MEKLIKKVSSVLNITFIGDYASRAGVTFRKNRRGTQLSVMVSSVTYSNVFGIITYKTGTLEMKYVANNIANIANIGKLIHEEMKKTQVRPHGKWFVTSNSVRTQVSAVVKGKHRVFDAVYSKSTGRQIGELKRVLAADVKPASIPALRVKAKEEQATASPQFDRFRFNKYVDLVAKFRKYYKVNANKLLKLDLSKEAQKQIDLNNPEQTLYVIIHQVRRMNGKEYKVSIETEVASIIKKVKESKK